MERRISPDGEEQWLARDGYWYTSYEGALVAGVQRPDPSPEIVAGSLPMAPQRLIPPSPTNDRKSPKKKTANRKVKWGRLAIIAAVAIGASGYLLTRQHADDSFTTSAVSVSPMSSSRVDIHFRVHNTGTSPGSPSCVVSVFPPGGNFQGTGTSESFQNPIAAGQYGFTDAYVTITNNDASAVTASDVQISGC